MGGWFGYLRRCDRRRYHSIVFCRIKKLSFLQFADLLLPSLVLGQSIGRWGNFMNQEAYGNLVTNPNLQFFPYAVYIEASGNWHQATFFYESFSNAVLLMVMLLCYPHFRRQGYLIPMYMIGYGAIRFVVEGASYRQSVYHSQSAGITATVSDSGCLRLRFSDHYASQGTNEKVNTVKIINSQETPGCFHWP